jgi:DNA-binding transcriptional MerR regulator
MWWSGGIMLSIGDLARRTRVSVRMLRHNDALGLITPVHVDERTGYRWYTASQIGRVNALVALKELGFTLEQCGQVLDEQMSVLELIDLLRTRQAELAQAIEADTQRLAEVGRRLRSIERGLTMTNPTLTLKALPALRLAQISAEVNDTTEIGAVVGPLFDTLTRRLTAAGLSVEGRGLRTYFGRPDGSKIDVAAAVPVDVESGSIDGVEIVELPAEETAAAVVYRGPAGDIADAWQTFAVATDEQGLIPFGVHRQVYLHAPDGSDEWVVELQCPVRRSSPDLRRAQEGD